MKAKTKKIIRACISIAELGVLVYAIRKERKLEKEVEEYDKLVMKYKISEYNKSRILEELDYCWNAGYNAEDVTGILYRMGLECHGDWFTFMTGEDRKKILGIEE